jgi:hypothetical protein
MAPKTEFHCLNYRVFADFYAKSVQRKKAVLVALPGLEPGLSALRGRRVNQLHHNARRMGLLHCDGSSIAELAVKIHMLR